ncbi:uncharacterized protein LOC128239826 [Mya arenaria]|uniref:uncharacterized protein LOC128239826 n=1 Tax=Mya arenaria TaxID=6604 RepID=UPI0022DFFE47|nr:uncharacterized protein LOC128239826 [Mya arenaria]
MKENNCLKRTRYIIVCADAKMIFKACFIAVVLLTNTQSYAGSQKITDADEQVSICLQEYTPDLPITFTWTTTDGQSTDLCVEKELIANCEPKFSDAFLYPKVNADDYEAHIDEKGSCTVIVRRLFEMETTFMINSNTGGLNKAMLNNHLLHSNASWACASVKRGEVSSQNSHASLPHAVVAILIVLSVVVVVVAIFCVLYMCIKRIISGGFHQRRSGYIPVKQN